MGQIANSKITKIIAGCVILAFILSIVAIFIFRGSNATANSANNSSSVGFIDTQQLIQSNPKTLEAQKILRGEGQKLESEFKAKTAKASNAEKEKIFVEYRGKLEKRKQELLQQILDNINITAEKVAKDKGLQVVLEKSTVFYGGRDITADVAVKIQSNNK